MINCLNKDSLLSEVSFYTKQAIVGTNTELTFLFGSVESAYLTFVQSKSRKGCANEICLNEIGYLIQSLLAIGIQLMTISEQ